MIDNSADKENALRIGESFRIAREKHNITLIQAAEKLKIRSFLLNDMEKGRFGHLRTRDCLVYAKFLGLKISQDDIENLRKSQGGEAQDNTESNKKVVAIGAAAVVGVTFRVGKYDLIVFHLQVEHHLIQPYHLLMEGELGEEVIAAHKQELVLLYSARKTTVDAVFASHALQLGDARGVDAGKVQLEVVKAAEYIRLLIGKTGVLIVGGANYPLETSIAHHLHARYRLLIAFRPVVDSRQQVAVDVNAEGCEGGDRGFGFWF